MRTQVLGCVVALAGGCASVLAQPTTPVYTSVFQDAVTGDNAFNVGGARFWTVDAGADSYQTDLYERPLAQTFGLVNGRYAAEEYHGYIDIVEARTGLDDRFFYVSIRVFDLNKVTNNGFATVEGLIGRYGVRFATDAEGRGGILLLADQPSQASIPSTRFTGLKTQGWRDADLDVGGRGGPIHGNPGPSGLSVTRTDNPEEEFGMNGYEQEFIVSDGRLPGNGPTVLWQRVSPTSPTTVELAFDYVRAGLTRAQMEAIASLEFQASLGEPTDAQGYRWNDKFTANEAGSPNAGVGGESEFGTQGLGAIAFVDTARGTVTPPPPPTACPCPADFDRSGGSPDGLDVLGFINAWVAGEASADADCSGGLPDGADLDRFLRVWLAGGC